MNRHRQRKDQQQSRTMAHDTRAGDESDDIHAGQRALVVPSSEGNVLWECVTLLDDDLTLPNQLRLHIRALHRGEESSIRELDAHPHFIRVR